MKYLLMIYMNPATWHALSEADRDEVLKGHDRLVQQLQESGELVGMAALADPAQSRTVQVRDDVPVVTDGPFAEAKEFLAGFYVVDCESPERADELAGLIPDARYVPVEVRPLMHEAGLEM